MKGVLVDSNVILDIFLNDPNWAEWSESVLDKYIKQVYSNIYLLNVNNPCYFNPFTLPIAV